MAAPYRHPAPLAAIFVVVGVIAALCSGCGSKTNPPTASTTSVTQTSPSKSTATTSSAPAALWGVAGCEAPSSVAAAFDHIDDAQYTVAPICPTDVGPGLGAEVAEEFSDLAAAEITYNYSSDPPAVLRVLVGTLKSGGGESFVDAFFSRVGPDARNGTIRIVGHEVPYVMIPDGTEGYAYGEGSTVVIGFIVRAPDENVTESPQHELLAGEAFSQVLAAATGAPMAPDAPSGVEQGPLGRGNFTTPEDVGWVFFKTEYGHTCGIGPNGTVAGCDDTSSDAPEGTNQTVVREGSPANYEYSDTPTFTRDVDILADGRRIDHGVATCHVGYQGTVGCDIGDHGFTITGHYGVLE